MKYYDLYRTESQSWQYKPGAILCPTTSTPLWLLSWSKYSELWMTYGDEVTRGTLNNTNYRNVIDWSLYPDATGERTSGKRADVTSWTSTKKSHSMDGSRCCHVICANCQHWPVFMALFTWRAENLTGIEGESEGGVGDEWIKRI